MGDSHVGYHHRQSSKKVSWHQEGACIERFCEAIEIGLEHEVDAVIHTGDIFDEEVSQSELGSVEDQLYYLKRQSIPFYYIYGNHENQSGRELLQAYSEEGVTKHLTTKRSMVGNPPVSLFGIDHCYEGEFHVDRLDFSSNVPGVKNILVLHHSIVPLSDDGAINLRKLFKRAKRYSGLEFDFVISGHHHKNECDTLEGKKIGYVGSTARISNIGKSSGGHAWLLDTSEQDYEFKRKSLGE